MQRQRQRVEAVPTRAPTQPSLRTRTSPVQKKEKPRTLDQSFSGVIDPSTLTVFGDNSISPGRSQPRLISQDIPQQQFQIPEVSKIRKLPDPKVVPEQDVKIVSDKESDQEFVEIPKLIRKSELTEQQHQPAVVQTPPRVQQPLAQPRPFVAFQANEQPSRPTQFQAQPAIPQQKSSFQSFPAKPSSPQQPERAQTVARNPLPQSSFQSFPVKPATPQQPNRTKFTSQQAVSQKPAAPFVPSRAQPEVRQPQPIPFQTIPAVQPRQQPQQPAQPLQQRQPTPIRATQQQTSNDIFEGRPSLFSQPIEIPASQGGASFSYEAVLG